MVHNQTIEKTPRLARKLQRPIDMDKQRMTFEIDRRTVTEGDIVEITWSCEEADSVNLTIDNGYRNTNIPLELTGSKRFRLNRSRGKTHLSLAVIIKGKVYSKKIDVRVKPIPTVRAETVDSKGKPLSKMKIWWQNMLTKWHNFCVRTKMDISSLPEGKQVALRTLIILGIVLLLSAKWPNLVVFGFMAITIYLLVVLLRK